MPVNQAVSFVYGTEQVAFSLERSNLGGPLILRKIDHWIIKDKLNRLITYEITVFKRDVDLNDIYFAREVFIPFFNFEGIITALIDNNDETLTIVVKEIGWDLTRRIYKMGDTIKEYNITLVAPASLTTFLQTILDSLTDKRYPWILGEDIPTTTDLDFDVKWKSYYEVLRLSALNSSNDLWFEHHKVMFGTKGKDIELDRDEKLYRKLTAKIDLENYGNLVHVIGAESGGQNLHAVASTNDHDLEHVYERVVSDNNLKTQNAVDLAASRVIDEFNNVNPDVDVDVDEEVIHRYDIQSGDVIKVNSVTPTQSVKGYFRVIEVTVSNVRSALKLQFSRNGKFLPRITDSLDIFAAAIRKIHDIELNS